MLNFHQITSFFEAYTSASDTNQIEHILSHVISDLSGYPRFAKLAITQAEISMLSNCFIQIGLMFYQVILQV
jgi:hypothetical protein